MYEIKDEIRIVSLPGRWVYIGRAKRMEDFVILKQCANIRWYGTEEELKKGLGRLSLGGPVPKKTQLDACGNIELFITNAHFFMECSEEIWGPILKQLHE